MSRPLRLTALSISVIGLWAANPQQVTVDPTFIDAVSRAGLATIVVVAITVIVVKFIDSQSNTQKAQLVSTTQLANTQSQLVTLLGKVQENGEKRDAQLDLINETSQKQVKNQEASNAILETQNKLLEKISLGFTDSTKDVSDAIAAQGKSIVSRVDQAQEKLLNDLPGSVADRLKEPHTSIMQNIDKTRKEVLDSMEEFTNAVGMTVEQVARILQENSQLRDENARLKSELAALQAKPIADTKPPETVQFATPVEPTASEATTP